MKIEFEEWLKRENFESEVNELFEESIICYKASAYRASLLFSYLGFQTVIKHRINSSRPAKDYNDGEWNQIKKTLLDDDKWDKLVFKYIENKKKPIFVVNDDIRNQYAYWRDRRNDCAHAKLNIISYPHVEGFWLFIQSNLGKFVVNGGMRKVLQEIEDYFNPVITPIGTSSDPIIKRVPSTIDINDFEEFLSKLKKFTEKQSKTDIKIYDKEIVELWSKLFELQNTYCEKLVSFLVENSSFSIKLIRSNPKILQQFKNENTFTRKLWREEFSIPNDYKVFVNLLRNKLIPSTQYNEIFNHMLDNFETIYFDQDSRRLEEKYRIDPLDEVTLKESDFFNKFHIAAFEENKIVSDFNWGNRNKELVIHYIKEFKLNEVIVSKINEAFNKNFPPYRLMKEIELYYKNNPLKLKKHTEISSKIGSTIPDIIDDLLEKKEQLKG